MIKKVVLTAILLTSISPIKAKDDFFIIKNNKNKRSHSKSKSRPKNKEVTVVLTAYWAKGGKTDRWSRKLKSSSGMTLQEGISVAADPKLFNYGTKLHIPGLGERIVVDTGTDVIKRTASQKRGLFVPVIDIFFHHKEDAIRWTMNNPAIVKVKIL